ncbi:hypothetical protein [Caenispirillum bisanense]|uniref:hypothetical protein n=1 Tax=Caenispirillum bisanense TaxID=414052 RepID=UPI0031D4DBDF
MDRSLLEDYARLTARMALGPVHMGACALDAVRCDSTCLTPDEQAALALVDTAGGVLLVVGPTGSDRGLRVVREPAAFTEAFGGGAIDTVVVADGPSALAAAALGRAVADAVEKPVAALVRGLGMAELATAEMGGSVAFGFADEMLRLTRAMLGAAAPLLGAEDEPLPSETLADLLQADPTGIRLLVGHGRGAFVIAEALRHMNGRRRRLTVVSLGAQAPLPEEVEAYQLIGDLDAVGWLNACSEQGRRVVPLAGHHLNRWLPGALPVTALLREILGQRLNVGTGAGTPRAAPEAAAQAEAPEQEQGAPTPPAG